LWVIDILANLSRKMVSYEMSTGNEVLQAFEIANAKKTAPLNKSLKI